MKKVFLGLLVAGVALSASAFTSDSTNSKLVSTFYGLNAAGTHYDYYGTFSPSADCDPNNDYPTCSLEYTNGYTATGGFDVNSVPGSPISLGGKGFINP